MRCKEERGLQAVKREHPICYLLSPLASPSVRQHEHNLTTLHRHTNKPNVLIPPQKHQNDPRPLFQLPLCRSTRTLGLDPYDAVRLCPTAQCSQRRVG